MFNYKIHPTIPLEERNKREIEIITNWQRLRKFGKLFPLLNDPPNYYTFSNPSDPWGSRSLITIDMLEVLTIEEMEKLRK